MMIKRKKINKQKSRNIQYNNNTKNYFNTILNKIIYALKSTYKTKYHHKDHYYKNDDE